MSEVGAEGRTKERICYRCKRSIVDRHWFTLSADYGGEGGERFQNTENRICVDCLAGIGMLEFEAQPTTGSKTESVRPNPLSFR